MQETNEQTPNQTIEITDLTVETEAANEVKGGPNSSAVVSLGKLGRVENQADQTPDTTLNHNETTENDEVEEATPEALDDLPVNENQEAEVKAGGRTGVRSFYIDETGILSNHNETMSDEAEAATAETGSLFDLPITEEQKEEVKGGGSPMLQGATNGTIGPQAGDATVVQGVNTAGTVRVNNLANLEAHVNHNETVAADEDKDAEKTMPLADLPLTEEQAELTKGAAVAIPAFMKNARKAKTSEA